jgi:hypothetical protein
MTGRVTDEMRSTCPYVDSRVTALIPPLAFIKEKCTQYSCPHAKRAETEG